MTTYRWSSTLLTAALFAASCLGGNASAGEGFWNRSSAEPIPTVEGDPFIESEVSREPVQLMGIEVPGETYPTPDHHYAAPAEPAELLPAGVDDPWTWHLLPEGLMYKSYLAGEKEPRLSTAFLYQRSGETYWDSVLGGRVGIIRYGTGRGIQPEGFQLDVEGGAFLRMQPQTERDVTATDYRIGVPLTYREGPFQYKFGYYHISSHLGDEWLLKHPGFPRRNYSRDALVSGVGYFPTDSIRLYFEVGWAFFVTDGAEPWEIQTGIEWSSNRPTGIRGEPYAAANVHLREETDWGGSINVLLGWQWRGTTSDHLFRTGLQFFNGANNQYSFLGTNNQFLGWGIRYDY